MLGFVPMAWTFVCPTEIIAFSERAADFEARNTKVVFASTDSEYSLLAWTNASRRDGGLGKIDIPLFADKNHQLSKDYGVLIEEEGIALRGLFIIDPNGIIRQVRVDMGCVADWRWWTSGRLRQLCTSKALGPASRSS